MRFHLISPDLLRVSSRVRSQYSTHVNLKKCGRLNPVAKLNLTAHLPKRAAGAYKGGSRSSPRAVSISLTLVRYPFTMRVRCA